MKAVKNNRQSNFELMRIFAMYMIVIWHIIIYGNLQLVDGIYGSFFKVIQALFIVHVNSFIILMGYFQYNKKFKWKKLIDLLFTSWFYRVFFVILGMFIGLKFTNHLDLFKAIFPFDMLRNYWFITYYILMYLFSPYINILISGLSQKDYKKLIIIFTIVFSIFPMISGDLITANDGYTFVQFIYLYLLGAYFGKYKIIEKYKLNFSFKYRLFITFLVCFLISSVLNLSVTSVGSLLYKNSNSIISFFGNNLQCRRLSYSNPIVVFQSLCFFGIFSQIKLKSKFVNYMSCNCLGIYLVSEHLLIQPVLYKFLKVDISHFNGNLKFIIYIFLVGFLIMFIGIVFESIRKVIFNFLCKIYIKLFLKYS